MENQMTAKEAQREYNRAWRAKNKDRVKAINARYWERKAKKMNEERLNAKNGREAAKK